MAVPLKWGEAILRLAKATERVAAKLDQLPGTKDAQYVPKARELAKSLIDFLDGLEDTDQDSAADDEACCDNELEISEGDDEPSGSVAIADCPDRRKPAGYSPTGFCHPTNSTPSRRRVDPRPPPGHESLNRSFIKPQVYLHVVTPSSSISKIFVRHATVRLGLQEAVTNDQPAQDFLPVDLNVRNESNGHSVLGWSLSNALVALYCSAR